jgi:glycerophosphoryl diester phosphodiesterase
LEDLSVYPGLFRHSRGTSLVAVTEPVGPPARPIVCAHRGASLKLPDNSIAAFEAAIASGCEMIETDVRADRLGRAVLSHDRLRAIETGSRHGRPRSRRSAGRRRPRPRRSRPGATAPVALEALLELSAGRVGLDLEIKEARVVPVLLDAIAGWDGALMLTSFDPAAIRAVRERDPGRATGLIVGPMHIGDPLTDALACDAQALVLAERRLTAKLLAAPSLALWVWTVNQPARLTRWLSEPALHGVITDDPATAVAVRDGLARDGTDLT